MNLLNIEDLLKSTNILIDHQKELDKLKGETFNIFSILKMESKENATHSAFLGELLNPDGSHLLGSKFLEIFLKVINISDHLDISSAKVHLEKSIGPRNDNEKTGGRIDIYIKDNKGNIVSIENKIYAIDQKCQIERYVNHERVKNKVLYLTRYGEYPTEDSRGDLTEGTDYTNISYRNHISTWLKDCMKEAVEIPILRETIKQYSILINKLTNTMGDEQKKLIDLIVNNFEAAEIIKNNLSKAKEDIATDIREEVYCRLKKEYKEEFLIELGSPTSSKFSQIWFNYPKAREGYKNIRFGIESFSGYGNEDGQLFVGVCGEPAKIKDYSDKYGCSGNGWWAEISRLFIDDMPIKFSNGNFLKNTYTSEQFRKGVVQKIVDECIGYVEENKARLIEFVA